MKIIPGAIVGKISGSLGGMTASHGRGGYYLRNRVKPVNSNTPRQQAVRSSLGALVQGWSSLLTPAQRAGWTAYANATPRTDRLGESLVLTGSQAYVACNTPRLQVNASTLTASLPRVDDAPTIPTLGEPPTGPVQTTTSMGPPATIGFQITMAVPPSDDGDLLIFVGTKLMTAGESSYRGSYQLAATAPITSGNATVSVATIDPTDPQEWAASIVPESGDSIALRLICLYDDGRVSQEYRELVTMA